MADIHKNSDSLTWKISTVLPIDFLPAAEEVVYAVSGDDYPSIAAFEIKGDNQNRLLEVYYQKNPDILELKRAIREMASIFNIDPPDISLEQLENQNWVAESQKILEPIDAGRFYLYGSHDVETIPNDRISILMEAGQAFGTGSHETTNGCLLAISDLLEKVTPDTALDLGCGSGVLAIAIAKQWNCMIIASDIDPIATQTTSENILANEVAGITAITCDGFKNTALVMPAPYDLVVANILAKPLIALAPDIVTHLNDNAYLVLSGLLDEQKESVLEAYEKLGMEHSNSFPINEWQTLVLRKK